MGIKISCTADVAHDLPELKSRFTGKVFGSRGNEDGFKDIVGGKFDGRENGIGRSITGNFFHGVKLDTLSEREAGVT